MVKKLKPIHFEEDARACAAQCALLIVEARLLPSHPDYKRIKEETAQKVYEMIYELWEADL